MINIDSALNIFRQAYKQGHAFLMDRDAPWGVPRDTDMRWIEEDPIVSFYDWSQRLEEN